MKRYILLIIIMALTAGCARREDVSLSLSETESYEQPVTKTSSGGEQDADGRDTEKRDTDSIFVYVCGHVNSPGVYRLDESSRIYEAVDMAGGADDGAVLKDVEMAACLQDGATVYIPGPEDAAEAEKDGRVNINRADADELCTLSGIGASKAKAILEYREKHGRFSSVEELMQVSGIGQGMFDRIKDSIKI